MKCPWNRPAEGPVKCGKGSLKGRFHEKGSFMKMPMKQAGGRVEVVAVAVAENAHGTRRRMGSSKGQVHINSHETGSGGSSRRPRQDREGEGVDEFAEGGDEEELALDTFSHVIVQYIAFPFLVIFIVIPPD
jgi:hypothetical protein